MNKNFALNWLNNLKEFWFIESAVSLFKNTTFYQETPFVEPYTTLDEINEEWLLKQNNQQYDGIYEIKFNENFECIYFKSWEMIK